jgi:hypothetical protein
MVKAPVIRKSSRAKPASRPKFTMIDVTVDAGIGIIAAVRASAEGKEAVAALLCKHSANWVPREEQTD